MADGTRQSNGSDSPPKKKREDFQLERILGEGSYSTVFLATDKASKKKYALKVLDKSHIIKEKKVQQVSREKEILSLLTHPFFVKLYFTFQDKERLCILQSMCTHTLYVLRVSFTSRYLS
jgi:3-phosphoinositide dependent protein kinase-1